MAGRGIVPLRGRKNLLFVNKKKQKKLCHLGVHQSIGGALQWDKSFLLIFFKKRCFFLRFYLRDRTITGRVTPRYAAALIALIQKLQGQLV